MTLGAENDNDVDWDDLFEPFQTGDPTSVDATGITDGDGNDINRRYAPIGIAGGQRITGDTGCTPYQGGDVADLFAAKGSRGAGLSISVPATRQFSCSTAGDSCTAAGTITANVYGGTAPYTYAWTKVSGNGSIVSGADTDTVQVSYDTGGTSTGTYRCTVTDSEGVPVTAHGDCTVTWKYIYEDDLAVTIPATASGSCSTSGSSCTAHATVTASVTGGQGSYGYLWTVVSGPGSISDGADQQTCTVSDSVSADEQTIVQCTVTDGNDFSVTSGTCTVTLSYEYTNSLTASVPATAEGDCYTEGSSCTASASVHCAAGSGFPPYSYDWTVTSGGATIQSGGAQATVVLSQLVSDTETSHVQCKVTDSHGYQKTSNSCALSLSYHHQNNLQASVPASKSQSCTTSGTACTARTTIVCTVSGGQSPFTYAWGIVSGGGIIESGGADATVHVADTVSSQDVTVYRCKVTDNLGVNVYSNNCSVTFAYHYSSGGGGGCVALDMWLEPGVLARDAAIGEEHDVVLYRGARIPRLARRAMANHFGVTRRPAVFLATKNLCALKLSADTPVNIPGASEKYGHPYWRRADAMLNERVATCMDGPIRWHIRRFSDRWLPPCVACPVNWIFRPWIRWSPVIAVLDAGSCDVAHLSYGGGSYLAGYNRWRRIGTHNTEKE